MNQGCLKALAVALLVAGILVGLLGVVFLLAPGRAGKGMVMLGVGIGLAAFTVSRLRALASLSPEYVAEQLTSLAAASDGELTVAAAMGQLRVDQRRAQTALQELLRQGLVQVEVREGIEYFRFPGLHETKRVKQCPYCGNKYPISLQGRACPSCGGNLEIVRDE